MIGVRKWCEFWLKVTQRLAQFLSQTGSIELDCKVLKIQLLRVTNESKNRIQDLRKLIVDIQLLSEFIMASQASNSEERIQDAKLIVTSVPKGINILDQKHKLLRSTLQVSKYNFTTNQIQDLDRKNARATS